MRAMWRDRFGTTRSGKWIVLLGLAALAVAGCVVESSPCDSDMCDCGGAGGYAGAGGSGGSSSLPIVKATIDANQTLETVPGEGVGVFVEYQEGGTWHVFTACDTLVSGLACAHNVVVTVPATSSFGNVEEDGLEGLDTVYQYVDGIELATDTSDDLDGVYFETDPGATLRFEVYLDGALDGRFVYWVGGGAVHGGAPSNPLDLVPDVP